MNTSSENKAPGNMQVVNVSQLSIEEINNLQEQIDNEVDFFKESLQQLKEVQQKLLSSNDSVSKLNNFKNGQDIMIPLTSSMYVPGNLTKLETVLIDIGTGYYVKMSLSDAKDFFVRKLENLTVQMEKVQNILQEKQRIKTVMVEILQTKVQEALQAQQRINEKSLQNQPPD